MMRALVLIAILCMPVVAGAQDQEAEVFLVSEYRYDPLGAKGDTEIGHTLCGTRCNALSSEYYSITGVEGWNLLEVAKDRKIEVALDNPYLQGRCVCTGNAYLARKTPHVSERPRTGENQAADEGRSTKNSRRWYEPPIRK